MAHTKKLPQQQLEDFSKPSTSYDISIVVQQIQSTDPTKVKILSTKTFYFSKFVLRKRSEYFETNLNFKKDPNLATINLNIECDTTYFNILLNYMLYNILTLDTIDIKPLYILCDMIRLQDAIKVICDHLEAMQDSATGICTELIQHAPIKKVLATIACKSYNPEGLVKYATNDTISIILNNLTTSVHLKFMPGYLEKITDLSILSEHLQQFVKRLENETTIFQLRPTDDAKNQLLKLFIRREQMLPGGFEINH